MFEGEPTRLAPCCDGLAQAAALPAALPPLQWQHGALFAAMLASTDAVAVAATVRGSGGPQALVALAEGESLLNVR